MMPYHLVALVSSKFSRSLKDILIFARDARDDILLVTSSHDVTNPISDWKLKLKFL